jgi:hypothetical protein
MHVEREKLNEGVSVAEKKEINLALEELEGKRIRLRAKKTFIEDQLSALKEREKKLLDRL